ncbi:uncharacterized protein [Labrus bergylta]|uniref:uncharacterized protein n=1 Tax=Labrus bergylta TaxID=56723 RepID=UPI00331411B4
MVELAWSSAMRLGVDQLEREIREEINKEKRLSALLKRKVTLEGLQMFLSVIRSKAEQDVRVCLLQLSNQLLLSSVSSDTGTRFKLALITKLQRATEPLVPQVVQTALSLLLKDPDPRVEDSTTQNQGEIRDSDLRLKTEASSAVIGRQLADAAASCFCLKTSFSKAGLLRVCTAVSRDIVRAVFKRFTERSRSFHLLDFDQSFFTARESVLAIVHDMMDDRLQRDALSWEMHQVCTQKELKVKKKNL